MATLEVTLKVEDGGLMHMAPLTQWGVGSEASYSIRPIGGLTQVKPFEVGGKHFLFLLRGSDGEVACYPVISQGGLGPAVYNDNWDSGWTSAEFYTVRGATYLFTLKRNTGLVHISEMTARGEVGRRVDTLHWTPGWTHVRPFRAGGKQFCLLYKKEQGNMHIHEINDDGTIGRWVQNSVWDSSTQSPWEPWRTIIFYEIGDKTFLLTVKEHSGEAHVNEMISFPERFDFGKVGPRIMTETWNPGWTHAHAYRAFGRNICFFLKSATGQVHCNEINADGSIGDRISTNDWTSGWNIVSSCGPPDSAYLVTVKPNYAVPLRRAYVEHVSAAGTLGTYMTDDEGKVGINVTFEDRVDIRVRCHNSVVKVIDGAMDVPWDVTQDLNVKDGDTKVMSGSGQQVDYYRVLNRCLEVYEAVFRQFHVFSELPDPDFPMGRRVLLSLTQGQLEVIGVIYKDRLPQDLAFVDATGVLSPPGTGWPVIHIKEKNKDTGLFGEFGQRPSLIPAELSHALHFSRLHAPQRAYLEANYGAWICKDYVTGGGGTHDLTKETDPAVALIEAMDHFSHRFEEFIRLVRNGDLNSSRLKDRLDLLVRKMGDEAEDVTITEGLGVDGVRVAMTFRKLKFDTRGVKIDRVFPYVRQDAGGLDIRNAFVVYETSPFAYELSPAGVIDSDGAMHSSSHCRGNNVEGAIYGAIFLDFAKRVRSLRTTVNAFFRSKALSFEEYRAWIDANRSEFTSDLDAVVDTWKL